jgi:hypothetical protein
MTFKFILTAVGGKKGDFKRQFRAVARPVTTAVMGAATEAAKIIVTEGRANIRKAGFSELWANALRVKVFPEQFEHINAAVSIRHNVIYSGAFEDGAIAKGSPFVWLPLPTVPTAKSAKSRGGRRPMRPDTLKQKTGGDWILRQTGGTLLAGMRARGNPNRADSPPPVSLRELTAGAGGSTARKTGTGKRRRTTSQGGQLFTVWLYHLHKVQPIPDKFDIREIVQDTANKMADLYVKNIK